MVKNIEFEKQKEIKEQFDNYEEKTRRGFLRLMLLRMFYEQAENKDFKGYHGYGLIQKIEGMRGNWTISPGSIYPLLKEFKKNNIIQPFSSDENEENKINYKITDVGIEVCKRLEQGIPFLRSREDFLKEVPEEILKKEFKEHNKQRTISDLLIMKKRFQLFIEILGEIVKEKESFDTNK